MHAVQDHGGSGPPESMAPTCRLAEYVRNAMDDYFANLNGEDAGDIYAMVISEVERPLLACVLEHCGGNQTRAASLLGLNRATLRKKLRTHELI
ncbi:helix-turn-helix domain-containing protein [Thioalkalivibrio sp.]|uniref:helix-turn-helix domain-containing protein n=1 Tax=Thioalkalivibrio sp. TaxID=2093813 RepID=UPI003974AF61